MKEAAEVRVEVEEAVGETAAEVVVKVAEAVAEAVAEVWVEVEEAVAMVEVAVATAAVRVVVEVKAVEAAWARRDRRPRRCSPTALPRRYPPAAVPPRTERRTRTPCRSGAGCCQSADRARTRSTASCMAARGRLLARRA